jgi:hypothetical protein
MRSSNQVNMIIFKKLCDLILSESVTYSSIVFSPVLDIFVWIWPKQVTEHAFVGNVRWSLYIHNVICCHKIRWKTSMHTKYLLRNKSWYRQPIKTKSKLLPYLKVIFSLTFIIKAIYSVDTACLMISPQQKEPLGILNFIAKKKAYRLNTLLSSINIVSHKKVLCWSFMWIPYKIKESKKINKLAMNVSK